MKPHLKRQKEFARLYASGLTAIEAARQAGYSESTAQTNAYRLLAGKRIPTLVDRYRGAVPLVSVATTRQCAHRLSNMLLEEQPVNRLLQITRTLTRLYAEQGRKRPHSLTTSREIDKLLEMSKPKPATPRSDKSSDRK